MRAYDIIWKKRNGLELSEVEIQWLVSAFVSGELPDYQMSAWCMAVFFQGMSFAECSVLTNAMLRSGETIDLASIPGIKVDKHSTGGVGDKTSLVLLPLVASCGVPVAKLSGHGLGHTGGTLDKLESIPGMRTNLSHREFLHQVSQIGIAITGQTAELVPADKKLYALRDLTATIESIPLIASSVVSKKLASGADAVLLDVKFGNGAFMSDFEQAKELARTMVEIGRRAGRRFTAVLSDMSQPLGEAIGNSLEVREAIYTLLGQGPVDLTELCQTIGGYMVWLGGKAGSPDKGEDLICQALKSGKGAAKLRELIAAQGGTAEVVDEPELLPKAHVIFPVVSKKSGYLSAVDCRELGLAAMRLGAGREKLEDIIRPEVGLIVKAKIGSRVEAGSILAEIYANSPGDAAQNTEAIQNSFQFSDDPIKPQPLIREII